MSDRLELLIGAVQTSLEGIPHQHDYRAKDVLVESARVQATCALAVAVDNLAEKLDQLVEGSSG